MLGDASAIRLSSGIDSAHVERGGSPPLFAVPARWDVLQP